ncbi:MAG: GDP-mannose 4,6-dehydratase [Gemmatimonadetes bacterium]|nr:GDP-mannose 4,6-dehydratase [Gemmatimonadota bacterium]MBP6668403.1 GDP-mannose 4,6-dehydratase [Gemmatimonadales bacterium]MBK6779550.1 GDP-mannose 4,6-dehydratase [Gemmatimonadota bacterium]MBK7350271.1 GDP-mannose 4,6-dehydratase [Gemmatimonadota bacterium]MBK7716209.1 GDP-mannose 4,6-dehydratase [Gemmatimonadota bacterium]
MKILVTGAGGFVGRWLVPALVAAGHEVLGTRLPGEAPPDFLSAAERLRVRWLPLELSDGVSVRAAVEELPDAVIHLAALASGAEARRDPGLAWEVNAAGTARLADALGQRRHEGAGEPRFLLVSTAEVYGHGTMGRLRTEEDPLQPVSPYASSKVGAEVAALEVARRTGLHVVIARSFPHTGPGQTENYVVPAFARRLAAARRIGAATVKTGNLEPVRDFLDVRDVVRAYLALLLQGTPGQAYNIASGQGRSLGSIFTDLAGLLGVHATPQVDPQLTRTADIPHLVGDARRLTADTGWTPQLSFAQTLQDVVNAQTD